MKKTVQIVTIPLDKKGFATGDICKCIKPLLDGDSIGETTIATHTAENEHNPYWQAQQLLVLSDDEIFSDDKIYRNGELSDANDEWNGETHIEWKKVIASYLHIEGTLPISKETVQAWIDAGTPEEGVVEKLSYSAVNNDDINKLPSLLKIDTQSNLLLSFPTDVTDQDIADAAKKLGQTVEDIRSGKVVVEYAGRNVDKLPYPELLKEMVEYYKDVKIIQEKPAVPTDEEIEEKGKDFLKEFEKDMKRESYDRWGIVIGYFSGYKQALKDLGYADN